MKYLTLIVLFIIVSCGNNEDILLPKSNTTIVKNVMDHSPIYIFFRTKEKDTLAEVNRKNEIISTNWIFNIDKRLPLRLVIPEIMKLQNKKREEKAHKNEKAQNYYSYADVVGKNLAFIPFTDVFYKLEKPNSGVVMFFKKNNLIEVNGLAVKEENIRDYLDALPISVTNNYVFCFAKDLSYGSYLQYKILMWNFKLSKLKITKEEFIY